ncbi:sugar ABC transporter ATP-binding protein [Lachnospiraceae bacterium OF09-33XD]|uniref:Sugar ABC transporter ATP-binding protein n=2 Tax=Wansuia hejianensis TaxID=2763667 RepID=A0A7G9GHZ8_9FIRM|nr:sugar ABC transporter ATP-binding protein [Wansuia hejianensis]RHV90995.1 sugar ABC transporter ATP-binding protein [Lachnospiraceae bacterium OF09-33XD]
MRGIIKEFSGVRVLNQVDFELKTGEVHALLGANGAGKSTLMKILNGIYTLTEGEIYYDGKKVRIHSPRDAYSCGITMIHQELDLVGCRDVSENIYLGRELYKDRAHRILDRAGMRREAQTLLDELEFDLRAEDLVEKLPPAKQQLILIARTVSCNSRVIVMDEPTSSLSHNETKQLFKVIKSLKRKGISIIYISHFLEEIFEVSDRLTVLRNGEKVTTAVTSECSTQQLIQWMIGRESVVQKNIGEPKNDHEMLLECRGLTTLRDCIKNVSFQIRKGEIVGFAGVVGAGRSEIAKMIFGAEKMAAGEIYLDGEKVVIKSPTQAVRHGISMVPEDRKQEGLVLKLNVGANMWLSYLNKLKRGVGLDYKSLNGKAQQMFQHMSIKCEGVEQGIDKLSGGNQQKVAIGKCLLNEPKLLILDQPTRGIDVGAKGEIYRLVTELARDNNTAILYISDELEEIIALCDRIYIVKQGQCVKEIDNHTQQVTKALLLKDMVD